MDFEKVPKHIGIIMDGNRRFAKQLVAKPWKGHDWGAKKIQDVLNWCREYNIKELTLYAFSIQNFSRPKEEFDYLMRLFSRGFKKIIDDRRLSRYGIRVNFIGRLWLFPREVQVGMRKIMDKTKENTNYFLNFAMAYGGREEVVDAAIKIAEKVKNGLMRVEDINEEVFRQNLYLASEPDLVIRTGGEKRTSNFLAFQSAYSEYVFLEKMWPEFEKEDFIACLSDYNSRKRRFGR